MAVELVLGVVGLVMDDTTERVQIDTKTSARTRNDSAREMITYAMNLVRQMTVPMFRGLYQVSRRLLFHLSLDTIPILPGPSRHLPSIISCTWR